MEDAKKSIDWTTREELLLACAVERYGRRDWKTVAMEIQVRSSLPINLLSSEACKSKFHDLNRRFMDDSNEEEEEDDVVVISWLEKLRKLRVLELKEQVHQSDLSIQRLQLEVKRLEEDENDISGDHDVKNLDLTETESPSPSQKVSVAAANNRHSNSSDFIDDSSATIGQYDGNKRRLNQEDEKRVNSAELSIQTTEFELRKTVTTTTTTTVSPATSDGKMEIRSQPLVELLDVIRSHKQIRMIERRQDKVVRQHVDLESIRSRIDDGSYSTNVKKFYRDLLLFFTNAIVSFPKTSSESAASYILRDLVLKHLKDNNNPSVPKPPLPEAKKEPSVAPVVVVCRRRSSVLAKKENVEDKRKSTTPAPIITKEKNKQVNIISSVKSLKRGMNTQNDKPILEKKKRSGDVDNRNKKKGVVEFLKRIVSKSPPEKPKGRKKEVEEEKKKSGSKGGKKSPERIVSGKRKRGKEEAPLRIAKKLAKK
ncbi:uncharacterized protein LOC124918996 isoform X2 [Impatiens glandulifera]|uniref:uncharacterized protein LOC124918996 isoform X2 n=1 Tax=Impatiens glandulifera TaxID=253017 RepID=UPI001FB05CED|nr:uncharacterized protein LOC124918996 isoform X2 [Impatiens glandulifera]